jgi:hypothetical protein
MLATAQQLADRRTRRRRQRFPLLGIETRPLGLIAGGQKRAFSRLRRHASILRRWPDSDLEWRRWCEKPRDPGAKLELVTLSSLGPLTTPSVRPRP